MKKIHLFLSLALFVALFPISTQAETVMRVGSSNTVAPEQIVDGNYYVSSGFVGNTTMSGVVKGDMIALGGAVVVNGEVEADIMALAPSVSIHGSVADDVRIIGGDVTIAGAIDGDLVVVGGLLKVLPTAEIGGDLFFFGGSANLEGAVTGSVFGTSEQMKIDGSVGKNVDVTVATGLTLADRASIKGDVSHTSNFAVTRSQSAVVEGDTVENKVQVHSNQEKVRDVVIPFLIIFFATLTLYLLFRREIEELILSITNSYGVTAFVGLGVFVIVPLLSILLMITVIGLFIGVIGLLLYLILFGVSVALAGIFFGALLAKIMTGTYEVSLIYVAAGSISLQIILLAPVIGPALFMALSIVILGGLSLKIYKTFT